jgi:hypothetical protein
MSIILYVINTGMSIITSPFASPPAFPHLGAAAALLDHSSRLSPTASGVLKVRGNVNWVVSSF